MTLLLAVDVGITGAYALLDAAGGIRVAHLPVAKAQHAAKAKIRAELDLHTLRDLWCGEPITHVFLESASARPKQGSVSTFRFGEASGQLFGLSVGLNLPCSFIRPQEWQKFHKVGPTPDAARLRAMQLFPQISGQFSKKKDNHRADAALIAAYGLHTLQRGLREAA